MKRFRSFIEDLDEAVEVRHDRYMRSHGKKARDSGHPSTWMFTHKNMGDVDYNNEKEVHTTRGKFADAKKSAQQWAKKHGHSAVYVMEEVELDEVSDKKLDAYRQKAFADQPAGDDGSDKYRKRKFGRDLAFAKQTGRAKVLATKEEVELDEASTKIEIPKSRYETILKMHGPKRVARTPKGEMQYRAAQYLAHDKKTDTQITQTYSHPDHGIATIEKHTHNPTGKVSYHMYRKEVKEEAELDEEINPRILVSIHRDVQSYKNMPTAEVLRQHKSTKRVHGNYSSQDAGGKMAMVSDLLRNKHGAKHTDHYFGMTKTALNKLKEEVELDESHFEVGDRVKCLDSGMSGEVVKLDKPEVGKYYTVKRDDGKLMKYAADELKLLKEDLDEAVKIGTKVRIHAPGKDYHGKVGHVGEIRKRTYGTMAPSYTVDYREPGENHNRSVTVPREKIKLHKEEVDLDEAVIKQGSKEHLKELQGMLDKAKPGSADHSQIRQAISSMFGDKHIPAKHKNVKPDVYEDQDYTIERIHKARGNADWVVIPIDSSTPEKVFATESEARSYIENIQKLEEAATSFSIQRGTKIRMGSYYGTVIGESTGSIDVRWVDGSKGTFSSDKYTLRMVTEDKYADFELQKQ
jgi:hypothetical protein